jgi:hypothetical protein
MADTAGMTTDMLYYIALVNDNKRVKQTNYLTRTCINSISTYLYQNLLKNLEQDVLHLQTKEFFLFAKGFCYENIKNIFGSVWFYFVF